MGVEGLPTSNHQFGLVLSRWECSILGALTLIQPETVVRWHRADFDGIGDGNRDLQLAAAGFFGRIPMPYSFTRFDLGTGPWSQRERLGRHRGANSSHQNTKPVHPADDCLMPGKVGIIY